MLKKYMDVIIFLLVLLFFTAPLGALLSYFYLKTKKRNGEWTKKEGFILKLHIVTLIETVFLLLVISGYIFS